MPWPTRTWTRAGCVSTRACAPAAILGQTDSAYSAQNWTQYTRSPLSRHGRRNCPKCPCSTFAINFTNTWRNDRPCTACRYASIHTRLPTRAFRGYYPYFYAPLSHQLGFAILVVVIHDLPGIWNQNNIYWSTIDDSMGGLTFFSHRAEWWLTVWAGRITPTALHFAFIKRIWFSHCCWLIQLPLYSQIQYINQVAAENLLLFISIILLTQECFLAL